MKKIEAIKLSKNKNCEHNQNDLLFEQSHDAFIIGGEPLPGYSMHPDTPLSSTMNRHQFCKKCKVSIIEMSAVLKQHH